MHDKGMSYPEIFKELQRLYPQDGFAKIKYATKVGSMLSKICQQRLDGSSYKTSEKDRSRKRVKFEEDSTLEEIEQKMKVVRYNHSRKPPNNHEVDKICPVCYPEESKLMRGKTLYQAWQEYLVIQKKKSTAFLNYQDKKMKEQFQSVKGMFNEAGTYIPRSKRPDVVEKPKEKIIEYDETSHTWTEE